MIVINDLCGDEDSEYLFKEYLKAYIFNSGPLTYNMGGLKIVESRMLCYLDSHYPRVPEFTTSYDKENRMINITFSVDGN